MKTVILCIVFLALGTAGGYALAAYLAKTIHQRQMSMMYASEVGLAAMYAEQLKSGEGKFVLDSLERTLPDQVVFLSETEMFKDNVVAAGALRAVKRFYVCTNTPIPDRIAPILSEISLADETCSSTG